MIGSDLLRYDKDRRYCVWDLETTGLCLGYALPWQLSYAVFTLERVIQQQTFYIWWDNLPISEGAARVTRFDPRAYKESAMEPDEVLRSLEAQILDPAISSVGHNLLGYDTMIHAVWRRKLGLREDFSYLPRTFDTLALSKAYKKGLPVDRDNPLAFQYRALSVVERGLKASLSTMGREFGIPFDEHRLHDASVDIRLNIEVFKQLLWKVEI